MSDVADLNLLQLIDPALATTPDGRFYAIEMRDGSWRVKDEQGYHFIGSTGRVASLASADNIVGCWVEAEAARANERVR